MTVLAAFFSPDDLSPLLTDYYISIWHTPLDLRADYSIVIIPINSSKYDIPVTLKVDNSEVETLNIGTFFFAFTNLTQGGQHLLSLTTEFDSYSATIKIPHNYTSYHFPQNFNFSSTNTATWALPQSNEHQVAYAATYENEDDFDEEEYGSEYIKKINRDDRTFTYPANCVTSYGDETILMLSISQYTLTTSGKMVVLVTEDAEEYYEVDTTLSIKRRTQRAINLINYLK